MKLEKLPNMPEPFGVKITDIPPIKEMTYSECRELGKVCMEYLVWVIEDQDMTKEKFSKFSYSWGRPQRITDSFLNKIENKELKKEFIETMKRISFDSLPGLGRVTGMRNEEGKITGIFADGEIDWHSNESGKSNPHPVVLLHAIEGTKNSQTQYLENVTQYRNLSGEDRKFVDSLNCLYYFDVNEVEFLNKEASEIQKFIIDFNSYPESGFNIKPLIQVSPGGHKGFAFNYRTFRGFEGKTQQESDEIIEWLKNLLIKDEYVYTHEWKDGDVMAFDQIVTLHKRPTKDCSKRLLHRIACNFNKIEGI